MHFTGYTPRIAAKIIRYRHAKDIAQTFIQEHERLEEVKKLDEDDKRIGGKYLNSYKCFLLIKKESNGLDMKTLQCYNKPHSDLSIWQAMKEIIPEVIPGYFDNK